MIHLEEMLLFVIAVHFFVLNFLIFLVHFINFGFINLYGSLGWLGFLLFVDSLYCLVFLNLLAHLRVRINLPRQFILFIWITFADDPFVISIFVILYDSLINWVSINTYDPLMSAILFELLIHLFLQDFFKTLIHLAI